MPTSTPLELVKLGKTVQETVNTINEAIEKIGDNSTEISNIINSLDEVGKVQDVKVNGTSVVTNKIANITVPTKTSDLTDDGTYIKSTLKGANNGIATLDSSGKVPQTQLPDYVDDVIEVASYSSLPSVGVAGKIYVTTNDGKIYRWGGSTYAEISSPLTIGEVAGTAYDGAKGASNATAISQIQNKMISGYQSESIKANEIVIGASSSGGKTVRTSSKTIVTAITGSLNVPTEGAVTAYIEQNAFGDYVAEFSLTTQSTASEYNVQFNYASHELRPILVVNSSNEVVVVAWEQNENGWEMTTNLKFDGTAYFISIKN